MRWRRFIPAILLLAVTMSGARASDWTTALLGDGISVSLPPGFEIIAVQGVDSTVRKIVGTGVECLSDLGAAADPLDDGTGRVEALTISGRPARLLRQDPDVDAIHIAKVGTSAIGPTGLTISCRTTLPGRRDDIRAMLKSIRIEKD